MIFHTYLFFTYWQKPGMYLNSQKSIVPMQTIFRHFIMKSNHNLILLKRTTICFGIQMKIISISKKLFWMQKPSILLPKQLKFQKGKNKLSQWMNNGILNSIKHRDEIFLKLKALSNGTDLHERLSENLKSYNKMLKTLIRQAQIRYYAGQFNKNKSYIRHTWFTIQEIINKCKEKRFPSFLCIERQKFRW